MNPVTKALDEIKYRIPYELLKVGFSNPNAWRDVSVSLDEQMLAKVIRPRVLLDCNLVGGVAADISLDGIRPEHIDEYTVVYRIPDDRTGGRAILAVHSIGYLPYQAYYQNGAGNLAYAAPTSMNSVTQATQRISDSYSALPVLANSQVELIGHNTILVKEQHKVSTTYYLRVLLENAPNLSNLSPRSYPHFAKLCELAIKSYLYNTLIVKIDKAYLESGQELGAFKNVLESYADAEEMYQTYLRETWMNVAFVNDAIAYDRFIRLQISPGI